MLHLAAYPGNLRGGFPPQERKFHMNITFLHRAGLFCLAFVVVAVLILLTPAARIAAYSSGVLDACINPGNGMMRLVDSSAACHANETFVEWNITGPQGPAGPHGPQGPPGASAGGPPFTWVCTPANFDSANNGNPNGADIDIFNGGSVTANVAAHFLSKDGTNLAGAVVPGSNPPNTYPGQTGNNTVAVAPQNTLIIPYQTGQGLRLTDNTLLATVVVTSDQPIAVGNTIPFGLPQAAPCSLLPK